jgi:hypothetical protein
MPDDLAEISQQAAQQIVPQAYTGPYQRDQHELILRQTDRAAKINQAAIEAAIRANRQQVAALAAATPCGTVAFRGDDGSGESIVAIRFDCRTEADEFVKLLESLGVNP